MAYRATRVEIDESAIRENVRLLKSAVQVPLMAVVKANAYGHGMVQTAKAALQGGADCLAVAIPEEGETLRQNGITEDILVLGGVNGKGAEASVQNSLTQVVFDEQGVSDLEHACESLGKMVRVHVKLDTGMGRIGVRTHEELHRVLCAIDHAPHVQLTGAFTHFAAADTDSDVYSRMQLARFRDLARDLPAGITLHASASAAMLKYPDARFDMVRAGIVMYGYPPVKTNLPIRRALTWKTEIAFIKDIDRGDCVSYGCTFSAEKKMHVATLPVGYGDGYFRALSNKADVLVRGKRCRILGRVCMDQMMVDVTDVPEAVISDEVVLLGEQMGEVIDAKELARIAGTIPYEILLSVSPRVPVIFMEG